MSMGVCNVFGRAYATGATSTAAVFAFTSGIINLYEAYRGVGHTNGVMKATTTARIYVQRIINEINAIPLVETIADFGTTILLSETGPVEVSLNFLRQNSPAETAVLASVADYPVESDVKDGVVYDNGLKTGTLEIVDTAQLATDLFAEIVASSDPLAVRLKNTATVSTVNDAIGSLNVIP
jgi:hypothetical protein